MGLTQIETGGIKDDAVTSVKIPDDAIGTTEIADKAITLAKLADGSNDQNGKFLRANTGGPPTFETIANTGTPEGTAVLSTNITDTNPYKFLRANGDDTCSWSVPDYSDSLVDKDNDGLVKALPTVTVDGEEVEDSSKFFRGDGTWDTPDYPDFVNITTKGLVKKLPTVTENNQTVADDSKFLRGDGEWAEPNYTATTNDFTGPDGGNAGTAGLVPAPASGDGAKYLQGDGTWSTPTDDNTQVTVHDSASDGSTAAAISSNWAYDHNEATGNGAHVPTAAAGDAGKYLKADGTWDTPNSYNLADGDNKGLLRKLPKTNEVIDSSKFLKGDGNWHTLPDFTGATDGDPDTAGAAGLVPQPAAGDHNKFLQGDGTWQTTPATDISGKADLSGDRFTGHINLDDDVRLRFGNHNDISFYHNDTNFFVNNTKGDIHIRTTKNESGTQTGDDIFIRGADDVNIQANGGDDGIKVKGEGAVELYHNNAKTLETTSTGIDITGDIVVSGSVDGIADLNTTVTANTAKVTNATHTGDVTGDTALTIADDKIEEKHINAGGTAGAGKVLVYDSSATGNWKWDDQSGSGGGSGTSDLIEIMLFT